MTINWRDAEALALAKVRSVLPDSFTVIKTGGSNPTMPDGLILQDGVPFRQFEVKIIPSAAGVQTVLSEKSATHQPLNSFDVATKSDEEFLRFESKQKLAFTPKMLELVNRVSPQFGVPYLLSGDYSMQAFEIFETKYVNNGTEFIIGIIDGEVMACLTSASKLSEVFTPVLTVRAKRSGSRALSKKFHEFILDSFDTHIVSGRKVFLDDVNDVIPARELINEVFDNIWVNNYGEFRTLGKTNNLTALLSLQLKNENINPVSDAELMELSTKVSMLV